MAAKRLHCIHSCSCICNSGHLNETTVFLVFRSLNWNPKLLCSIACVCKWFEDLSKRVLWKEFCLSRAPRMVSDLAGASHSSINGRRKQEAGCEDVILQTVSQAFAHRLVLYASSPTLLVSIYSLSHIVLIAFKPVSSVSI